MAVFRVQKTQNYTVMSNHHLNDKALSLKAKGLLSLMLSLPEDWDYTTRGLASICKEGVDGIRATVRELENAGYIIRRRVRDQNGQVRGMEYTVFEQPRKPEPENPVQAEPEREKPVQEKPAQEKPAQEKPAQEKPAQEKPAQEKPAQEKPAQLNTKETNNEKSKYESDLIRTQYRDLILDNIEYALLAARNPTDRARLDELVHLMLDTICARRKTIRIAQNDFPTEVVKSQFLKLNAEHIQYVLDRMRQNTTEIRNIKQYLLAALYNAPLTMENYYAAQISHDLYGRN